MPFHVLISIFFGSSYSLNEIRDSDRHTNIVFRFQIICDSPLLFKEARVKSRLDHITPPDQGSDIQIFSKSTTIGKGFHATPFDFCVDITTI